MPWHGESEDGKVYKYQYHPHGDKSQPLRAAPSAMNTVIVPNVTLPEVWIAGPFVYAIRGVTLELAQSVTYDRVGCFGRGY
jgi:hypothetical protein